MKFAAPQLKAIIRAMQGSGGGREKRRSQRFPVDATVQIARLSTDGQQAWKTALTRDISDGGLGLVTSTPLRAGERIAVKLPAADDIVVVACVVAHARDLGEGLFTAGVEFAGMLDMLTSQAESGPAPAANCAAGSACHSA